MGGEIRHLFSIFCRRAGKPEANLSRHFQNSVAAEACRVVAFDAKTGNEAPSSLHQPAATATSLFPPPAFRWACWREQVQGRADPAGPVLRLRGQDLVVSPVLPISGQYENVE